MKLSHHSKMRLRERTSLNHKERKAIFKDALNNGFSVGDIQEPELKTFLASKIRYNSAVKLYKGFIFIYSRNKHQLYTVYKLPEELKELGLKYFNR